MARRIASQENINLHNITGSGPNGRIVKSDVEGCIGQPLLNENGGVTTIPITGIRQVIADRLVESKQQVPHFYLEIECVVDKLLEFRTEINAGAKLGEDSKPEYKISINDFLVKAAALSLARHPKVNSSWQKDVIIQYNDVDICVAVAIDDGLMTPIVKNANRKNILQISAEVKELAKRLNHKDLNQRNIKEVVSPYQILVCIQSSRFTQSSIHPNLALWQ